MLKFSSSRLKSWPSLSPLLLTLLLMLELVVWYPVWLRQSEQQARLAQDARRLALQATATGRQTNALDLSPLALGPSLTGTVLASKNGIVTQWALHGEMSLSQWQMVQEWLQEQVALGLVSAHWQVTKGAHWQGDLVFDVLQPKATTRFQDWLPVRLLVRQHLMADWELVSIVRVNQEMSALLSDRQSKRWVTQGAWLPNLGMTVQQIQAHKVQLVSVTGATQVLHLGTPQSLEE